MDFLDLSRLVSEYGRVIYPCKACVSTAQPLCHWPCSCYPNHDAFDRDTGIQDETRNAALSLVATVRQIRSGRYVPPDAGLTPPRKK